ncbi:MAG TPA: GNAT family N-acetyltransferase [bacterium]|nr:GNAT family N-acetyltransferase [bacterium]HQI48331.1 GNAT family N-acetyltransferase [bacterium]HQJ64174.1 GNAT family N-acetyltransferase [bacterium]
MVQETGLQSAPSGRPLQPEKAYRGIILFEKCRIFTIFEHQSGNPIVEKTYNLEYSFRTGTPEDLDFLKGMLYQAALWSPEQQTISLEELLNIPEITRILEDWPNREGDHAVIAVDAQNRPIGAAWYRFWSTDHHSFGFVDAETPELGIAIVKTWRSQGIGRALMQQLISDARARGIERLSLSVDSRNYAADFYKELGFRTVGESSGSWTMLKEMER